MRRLGLAGLIMVLAACGGSGGAKAFTPAKPRATVATTTTEKAEYDDFGIAGARDAACRTEAETFFTAVNAYRANFAGALPKGRDAAAIARLFATPGAMQLLQSSHLKSNDPHNPPAAFHWYYNVATGLVTHGSGC